MKKVILWQFNLPDGIFFFKKEERQVLWGLVRFFI